MTYIQARVGGCTGRFQELGEKVERRVTRDGGIMGSMTSQGDMARSSSFSRGGAVCGNVSSFETSSFHMSSKFN